MKLKLIRVRKNFLLVFLVVLLGQCYQEDKVLPGLYGTGQITGRVVNIDGDGIQGVTVDISGNGQNMQLVTDIDGFFYTADLPHVERGNGYNISLSKSKFDTANTVAIFDVPSLKVDVGNVMMYIAGSEGRTISREIYGQIIRDITFDPVENVNVVVRDSLGNSLLAKTDSRGKFRIEGKYFAKNSTYALTVSKDNFTTQSDVVVKVTASSNKINNNPVRFFPKHGDIVGYVNDDTTGNPLQGAKVTIVDSNNSTKELLTDASGKFQVVMPDSAYFLLGERYNVKIEKSTFTTFDTFVDIEFTGENEVAGATLSAPKEMLWDVIITGQVKGPNGDNLENVKISIKDTSTIPYTLLYETVTDVFGTYTFSGKKLKRAGTYIVEAVADETVNPSSPNDYGYTSVAGKNVTVSDASHTETLSDFTFAENPPPNYEIHGIVTDYWEGDDTYIQGASVRLLDDNGLITAITGVGGEFVLEGNFTDTKSYTIQISKTGYTGRDIVDYQEVIFTYNATYETGVAPKVYDLDETNPKSTITSGTLQLYPIGIFASIEGQPKRFTTDIKDDYDIFLTGKPGLTISARYSHIAISPSAVDSSTFYLHLDDDVHDFVAPPIGNYSTFASVNGKLVKGYIQERIQNETRSLPFGLKNKYYFHFYNARSGTVTIQTLDGVNSTSNILYKPDTYIRLISGGRILAEDDNTGSGTNARVSIALLKGWYSVEVSGADDFDYGFYRLQITGPDQTSPYSLPYTGTTDGSTGNIILSWYDQVGSKMYIAGEKETGSSGTITLEKMEKHGGIIRGTFNGQLRYIGTDTSLNATIPPTGKTGFFNIVRSN